MTFRRPYEYYISKDRIMGFRLIARGMMAVITCRLYIKNIDYLSVVERLMPVIARELSDLDNVFTDTIKKIISKNNKPRVFTKVLVSLIPNKDELAVSLLQQYSYDILLYANKALHNLMIIADIKSIKARTLERACGRLIKLEIQIGNIDYEQTAVNLMPMTFDVINKDNKMAGKAISIITKNYKFIEKMLRAALKELPEDEKNEMLVNILREFRKEIIDAVNQAIIRNGIKAELKDINFASKPCQNS